MPRGARLDAPGTLDQVIVRGIERRTIVNDEQDRDTFICRLGAVAQETGTAIYAWALLSNHAHILLRGGSVNSDAETALRLCHILYQTSSTSRASVSKPIQVHRL